MHCISVSFLEAPVYRIDLDTILVSCEKHTASQTKLLGLRDAFAARVASTEGVCIGHGQCI